MNKESLKMAVIDRRLELEMSKKDLAEGIGMSLPTYYKFEKTGDIDIGSYLAICKLLKLTVIVLPDKYVSGL